MSAPAEMSHGFSFTSQKPSMRPAATYAMAIAAGFEFLREHDVIRKALRDQRAEHPLDVAVDLRDQIDRPFLLDLQVIDPGKLHRAGPDDRLDRRREKRRGDRVRHRRPA